MELLLRGRYRNNGGWFPLVMRWMNISWKLNVRYVVIGGILSLGVLSTPSNASDQPGMRRDSVSDVVSALESCPAWSDPKASGDAILATLGELSGLSTSVLRAGIERFVTRYRSRNDYDVNNMAKLFVLNRFVFAVPEKEIYGGPFFGGWQGVPHDQQQMNPMWPLAFAKNGKLQLVGKYSGYSGHPYLAVQEFDHFLVKYGRRQLPSSTSPSKSSSTGQP